MGQIGEVTDVREIAVPDRTPEPLSPDAPEPTHEPGAPGRAPAPAAAPASTSAR
jgi:hypothetical protein